MDIKYLIVRLKPHPKYCTAKGWSIGKKNALLFSNKVDAEDYIKQMIDIEPEGFYEVSEN